MTDSGLPPDEWFAPELDFTVARSISDRGLIAALRDYFAEQSESRIEVDRRELNEALDGYRLSKSDAEPLFTGLVVNGVADQASSKRSFADYSFLVECEPASKVLEGQRVARAALEDVGWTNRDPDELHTELTATFPPAISRDRISAIRPLSTEIRQLLFDADDVVRIANPYFDPTPAVVGDVASLANRGVETRILTRETESASSNLKSTLNSIHERIDSHHRHRLKVRDLYERDTETGQQAYATHAKIAIADRDLCYLGSANLTDTSLSNNFELGVLLRGENVDVAVDLFDTVFNFARTVELPL